MLLVFDVSRRSTFVNLEQWLHDLDSRTHWWLARIASYVACCIVPDDCVTSEQPGLSRLTLRFRV